VLQYTKYSRKYITQSIKGPNAQKCSETQYGNINNSCKKQSVHKYCRQANLRVDLRLTVHGLLLQMRQRWVMDALAHFQLLHLHLLV